jgi:hypothetical protein
MAAALTINPASGSITAKSTVCRVTVAGQEDNRGPHNIGGAFAYYLKFSCTGQNDAKSYVFNVSADGDHVFNNYVFPAAGSWTLDLCDNLNGSVVETLAVTVA